jgi:hypothetical protein
MWLNRSNQGLCRRERACLAKGRVELIVGRVADREQIGVLLAWGQKHVLTVAGGEERAVGQGVEGGEAVARRDFRGERSCLMNGGSMYPPLVVGAGIKISYELLLCGHFAASGRQRRRPPEKGRPWGSLGPSRTHSDSLTSACRAPS